MRWFRLYHDLATSKRVGRLSDRAFRVYLLTLCAASRRRSGGRTGLTIADASWEWRFDVTQAIEEICATAPPLLVLRKNEIVVPDWIDKQMPSDSSSSRVSKHRYKNKGLGECNGVNAVTNAKCNGPDKSRDVDVVPLMENSVVHTSVPSLTLPAAKKAAGRKTGTRLVEDWRLPKRWGEWALEQSPVLTVEAVRAIALEFRDHWIARTGQIASKADWQATWRNWVRRHLRDMGGRRVNSKADKRAEVARAIAGGGTNEQQRDAVPGERDITAESKRIA